MTPEEALQIIDNVLAQVSLNRAQHEQLMQAVGVLRAAVAENPLSAGDTG